MKAKNNSINFNTINNSSLKSKFYLPKIIPTDTVLNSEMKTNLFRVDSTKLISSYQTYRKLKMEINETTPASSLNLDSIVNHKPKHNNKHNFNLSYKNINYIFKKEKYKVKLNKNDVYNNKSHNTSNTDIEPKCCKSIRIRDISRDDALEKNSFKLDKGNYQIIEFHLQKSKSNLFNNNIDNNKTLSQSQSKNDKQTALSSRRIFNKTLLKYVHVNK